MAKKKMTKAQAASARREVTANSIAKKKAHEDEQYMKEVRRRAQKKANSTSMLRFFLPFLIGIVIIIFALFFTIGPGLVLGQ